MSRRLSLLHPILVALFPVLSLVAQNAATVSIAEAGPAAALCLAGALLLWGFFRLLLGDWPRSAVMTSITLAVFFSYGHVRLSSWSPALLRNRYLLPLAVCLLAAVFWALRRMRHEPVLLAQGLTLVTAFLIAGALARIAWHGLHSGPGVKAAADAAGPPARGPEAVAGLPDIYYVILDGYASARTLQEVYGFDNRAFLAGLTARGFYVADSSHSNYSQTPLSLASSTNMNYIDPALESSGRRTNDLQPLYRLIEDNRLMRVLKRRGYKIVNFQSGWTVTARNRNADWDVNCGGWKEFNRVLAQTTVLVAFGFSPIEGEQSRKRVLCQLETLAEIPRRIAGPRFVFAHIVSPEPPLLFGRNGEEAGLGSSERPYKEWRFKSRYVDQVVFLNQKVIALVDRILAQARTPPVVVLQSDHGSASGAYEWMYSGEGPPATGDEPNLDVFLRERMEILNAYYLPGPGARALYPSISPVNSFRVVLNASLGEHEPLLPDRSFFSRYAYPFHFIDVTARLSRPASP